MPGEKSRSFSSTLLNSSLQKFTEFTQIRELKGLYKVPQRAEHG